MPFFFYHFEWFTSWTAFFSCLRLALTRSLARSFGCQRIARSKNLLFIWNNKARIRTLTHAHTHTHDVTDTIHTTGNKLDEIYATVNVAQKLNFSSLWAKLSDSHVILEIVQPIWKSYSINASHNGGGREMMMVVEVVMVPSLVLVLVPLCVFAKTTWFAGCLSHYIISHSFSFKFSTFLVHLSCGDGGVGGDGNHPYTVKYAV